MADSNHFPKREVEFEENDPFAELTRIMGRDPRSASSQPASDESFEIDLERELMGEFSYEDEVAAQGHAPAPEVPVYDQQPEDDIVIAVPELAEVGADVEADEAAYAPASNDYPASDGNFADPDPAQAVAFDPELERVFDEEFSEAASGWVETDALPDADPVTPIPAAEPFPVAATEDYSPAAELPDDEPDWDDSAWQDSEPVAAAEAAPELAAGRYDEPAAETQYRETAVQPAMDHASGLAEVDMDFGELDLDEDAVEAVAFEPGVIEPEAEEVPLAAAAEQVPAELSLEDELSMLLSSSEEEVKPVQQEAPQAELASESWQAAEAVEEWNEQAAETEWQLEENAGSAYGRANYSPAYASANVESYRGSYALAERADAVHDDAAGEAVREDIVNDLDFDDQFDLSHDELAPEYDEPAPVQEEAQPAEPDRDPFSVFANMASFGAATAAPAVAKSYEDSDEIDTVEVPDSVVPVSEDLDLPELALDESQPQSDGYENFDEEFADIFAVGESRDPLREMPDASQQEELEDERYLQEAFGGVAALGAGAAAARGVARSTGHISQSAIASDEFDYDAELEREIAQPRGAAARPVPPRRNNLLYIAGAVAGLVVLGGIGAFALTSGGSDASDTPALVRADNEPLKVKPENPGGVAVPNQDSQAYERAAGGAGDTVPAQTSLVTATEEPVDVAARVEPEAPAPGMESDNGLPGVSQPAIAKAEDRLEVTDEDVAGVGTSDDLVAVAPRRVRTMVVRPDGTLVPREEPALPAQAAPAAQSGQLLASASEQAATLAPAVGGNVPAAPTGQAVPAQPAAPVNEANAAPAPAASEPVAPATVAAPAPRPAAPQPAPAQPQRVAAAAPAARTAPAAPAPAAAGGEWSMQIASQPSAEGAQATYQDLARRYGDILSGRGVNIVRADIEGKGTYYRVRIPSSTRADAIALCERYKAAGGSCFVSK